MNRAGYALPTDPRENALRTAVDTCTGSAPWPCFSIASHMRRIAACPGFRGDQNVATPSPTRPEPLGRRGPPTPPWREPAISDAKQRAHPCLRPLDNATQEHGHRCRSTHPSTAHIGCPITTTPARRPKRHPPAWSTPVAGHAASVARFLAARAGVRSVDDVFWEFRRGTAAGWRRGERDPDGHWAQSGVVQAATAAHCLLSATEAEHQRVV